MSKVRTSCFLFSMERHVVLYQFELELYATKKDMSF
jgi:hypothetical protein